MKLRNVLCAAATAAIIACGESVPAQVQTIVPAPVPGAKPTTVEHIKIHATSLEGNLEGDAVDRDVIVFLPPSYHQKTKRRYPVVCAFSPEAIAAAKNADTVIAVIGITSQFEGEEMPVSEPGFLGGDRTSIDLPQPEEGLVEAVAATGKPLTGASFVSGPLRIDGQYALPE